MIIASAAPQAAPCINRVSESPLRMGGKFMVFPFARTALGQRLRKPGWAPVESWDDGPAALRWRFGCPTSRSFEDKVDVEPLGGVRRKLDRSAG
jgi:hypothetical protein